MIKEVRILSSIPDTDWYRWAEANGVKIIPNAFEVLRPEMEFTEWRDYPSLKIGDDPAHGLYWKYANNICKCEDCTEAGRIAKQKYRETGRYGD